jgi:hypothetical protein
VSESGDSRLQEFEKRSREVLEASAEGLGADVRSRLTQARFRALEELGKPAALKWFRVLAPAGGLAAAALVAVIALRGVTGGPETVPFESGRGDVLEVVAMADDYDLLEDDVEFYQWLDSEPDVESVADFAGVG